MWWLRQHLYTITKERDDVLTQQGMKGINKQLSGLVSFPVKVILDVFMWRYKLAV